MSYRIVVGENIVPLVHLYAAEKPTLTPKPKDISLTGIMIEFDPPDDPDLTPEMEVWLNLSLDGYSVRLRAVVRHREDNRYFLFFPEVVTKHGINAPQPLRNIIETLERAWFEERIHQDGAEKSSKMKNPPSEDMTFCSSGESSAAID
jgi:hypothetical protein